MTDLQKAFQKEPKNQKGILLSAAVVFIGTFLPWMSMSLGPFGGVSVNGWHSFGLLSVLGSAALVLVWLLPKLGIKLNLPAKPGAIQKVLAVATLAGPVIALIQSDFSFSFLSIGFYLALAGGAGALFFSLQK